MAVTGFVFICFVMGHMVGNLQIFLGRDQLNSYAEALHHLGFLLWFVRIFFILFFVLHVWTGIRLYLSNRGSRPVGYSRESTVQASLSSRFMVFSGLGLLIYVIYHLLHFTFLVTNPDYSVLIDSEGRFDVYTMVVMGFRNYWISGFYILASASLAFHINHAVPSLFQTIGLCGVRWYHPLRRLGNIVALVLFLGYVSIPVSVLSGLLDRTAGGN